MGKQDLLSLLRESLPQSDSREVDPTTLKYVLYSRKSTKGEERQERSIDDQVADCIKREVEPNSLHVVGDPIEERQSAKEPDIRPEFRKMLDGIKAGKYDGIIAWHPDRLSRNMKEAGEIIDLLDKGILKDLRFATSTFENSPTGKMLLGISFVLSKQYSEHLSESVTRGNRHKTEKGYFFGRMKHGYYMSVDDGKLFPDGNNFVIIMQAFEKRVEGLSQLEIARWLNKQPYTIRKRGKDPEKYKWDKDSVSKLLKDPVYAGVLKYGNHVSRLADYYEFEPMLSEDEFLKINKVSDLSSSKIVSAITRMPRESVKADLLRSIVHCGACENPYSSGVTSKKLKDGVVNYYYYRCETDGCEFKNKSVRANVVIKHASDFLSDHLFIEKKNYEKYRVEATEYAQLQAKQLSSDIGSLTKQVGLKEQEYERAKETVSRSPKLAKHYDLDAISNELDEIKGDLSKLVTKKANLKRSELTYKEYLELFSSIGVKIPKIKDLSVLDEILRIFFSNFTVNTIVEDKKQRYEITSNLKEPWNGFLKSNSFVHGRGERT